MTAQTIIGFTGTQQRTPKAQREMLATVLTDFWRRGTLWMHNGDCIESDEIAGAIWRGLGGMLHLHPPSISTKRAFQASDRLEDPKPYLVRNHDIVDASNALVAVPAGFAEEQRSGTWATIRYARKSRMPIVIILPDGSIATENCSPLPLSEIERPNSPPTALADLSGWRA